MRRFAIAAALVMPSGVAACVDLFHDTSYELPEAGSLDASVEASAADSATQLKEFCDLDFDEATAMAKRSCALLAACESPMGSNATGKCLEDALPTFACKAAPGRAPRGARLEYYRCLAAAKSCDDTVKCIFPTGVPADCGQIADGGITTCGAAASPLAEVRLDCRRSGSRAYGEACIAKGRTCRRVADYRGECTGSGGLGACASSGCVGTSLRQCVGGNDVGFDCATVGAGRCVDVAHGSACVPTGSGTCPASTVVTCQGTTASGCPGGVPEVIDCAVFGSTCHRIAGASADAGAREGGAPRSWDIARACDVPADAGACSADRCVGDKLVACVRGAPIEIDCRALLGSRCGSWLTAEGERFACVR